MSHCEAFKSKHLNQNSDQSRTFTDIHVWVFCQHVLQSVLRRWPVVHGHSKVCKPPAQFAFWIFIPKPSIPHFVFWVFTVNSFSAGGTCGVFSLWTSPTSQLRSSPYKCTVCCIHIMTRGYFTLFMIFSYFFALSTFCYEVTPLLIVRAMIFIMNIICLQPGELLLSSLNPTWSKDSAITDVQTDRWMNGWTGQG